MPMWFKASGIIGSILVLIALVTTFLKQVIALVAFLSFALKILVVVAFVALLVGIGYLVLKGYNDSRRTAA